MRLFTSKKKSFRNHLEHERQNGYLRDESPLGEWFVTGLKLAEVKESQSIVLSLYTLKKGLGSKIMSVYNIEENTVFIGDISSRIENKGYGSILMVNIIDIAKRLNADTITGNLSETDSAHFDKLEHFYKKHGFIVNIDASGKNGTILRRM
ncbi:hypothetical protein D3C73_17930 [compost metagenome]